MTSKVNIKGGATHNNSKHLHFTFHKVNPKFAIIEPQKPWTQSLMALSGPTAVQRHVGLTAVQRHIGPTAVQHHIGPTAVQRHVGPTAVQRHVGPTAVQRHVARAH